MDNTTSTVSVIAVLALVIMSQAALCGYIGEHKPGLKLKVAVGAVSCIVFVFSGAVLG